MGKTTFANKVRRKKKVKAGLEVVAECDNPMCRKTLVRTCCRTDGSLACAEGEGIVTKKLPSGWIGFYCCRQCRNAS